MNRPTLDEWALGLAMLTALRSTCYRRQVGCVLLDKRGHVLSTGYNGVAAGLPHCNEDDGILPITFDDASLHYPYLCAGVLARSGEDLDQCKAIHAEQNALLQCRDVYQICTAYVTTSPCVTCTKLLLNTSCKRIVFIDEYTHLQAKQLWQSAGRTWERGSPPDLLKSRNY